MQTSNIISIGGWQRVNVVFSFFFHFNLIKDKNSNISNRDVLMNLSKFLFISSSMRVNDGHLHCLSNGFQICMFYPHFYRKALEVSSPFLCIRIKQLPHAGGQIYQKVTIPRGT